MTKFRIIEFMDNTEERKFRSQHKVLIFWCDLFYDYTDTCDGITSDPKLYNTYVDALQSITNWCNQRYSQGPNWKVVHEEER